MRIPRNFLRDDLSVEAYSAAGARGPTYGTAATIRASVQPTTRVVIDAHGRETQADVTAMIRPEDAAGAPLESRVTWNGAIYRVLRVAAMPDVQRPTHYELMMGALAT